MRRATILTLACALLLVACETTRSNRPTSDEMSSTPEFEALDRQVVWEVVMLELSRAGLMLDSDQTSEIEGKFETHWEDYYAPFRFEGRRKKVLGVIEETAPNRFHVRVIAWVQRNASMMPDEPTAAVWQDISPDETLSEHLLGRILSHFDNALPVFGK